MLTVCFDTLSPCCYDFCWHSSKTAGCRIACRDNSKVITSHFLRMVIPHSSHMSGYIYLGPFYPRDIRMFTTRGQRRSRQCQYSLSQSAFCPGTHLGSICSSKEGDFFVCFVYRIFWRDFVLHVRQVTGTIPPFISTHER